MSTYTLHGVSKIISSFTGSINYLQPISYLFHAYAYVFSYVDILRQITMLKR